GIFTLCAFRSVPECCGTASPRAPPKTALHVWTDLRGYALNFQQPSVGSRQESITVRLRSTPGFRPERAYSTSSALLNHQFWGPPLCSFGFTQVRSAEVLASVRYPRPISLLFSRTTLSNGSRQMARLVADSSGWSGGVFRAGWRPICQARYGPVQGVVRPAWLGLLILIQQPQIRVFAEHPKDTPVHWIRVAAGDLDVQPVALAAMHDSCFHHAGNGTHSF